MLSTFQHQQDAMANSSKDTEACDVHKLMETLSAEAVDDLMSSRPQFLAHPCFEAPSGLHLARLAPPSLSLDQIVTDDPFQPTPKAEPTLLRTESPLAPPGLASPPPLCLESIVTDDPFRPTPKAAPMHSRASPVVVSGPRDLSSWSWEENSRPAIISTPAASFWTVEAKNTFLNAQEVLTVTWMPGPIGIKFRHDFVDEVHYGGQAQRTGVKPGMYFKAIDDAEYTPGLLDEKIGGSKPYKVELSWQKPPSQLVLQRSQTDPVAALSKGACEDGIDLPLRARAVPPPIDLESCPSVDPFEYKQRSLGVLAPPPLSLEQMVTDDPFRTTPKTVNPLAPCFALSDPLDFRTTAYSAELQQNEDTWSIQAKNTFVSLQAPKELSLERAKTDPMPAVAEEMCEQESDESPPLSPHQLAPPLLDLEAMATADPFEALTRPCVSAGQLAYVSLAEHRQCMCPPPPPFAPAPSIEPTPPTRPPSMPAPAMDMPEAPQAPRAPPSRTPGASAATLVETELCKPGVIVRTNASGDCTHVHWAVDARKLQRQDKQAVSPKFMVELPELGPMPFKLVLYAKDGLVNGKKGAGFVKVKGCGRVVLKCESQLPESCSEIAFRIGVGRDDVMQPFRGPAIDNFFEQSCHGLTATEEEWDFSSSVDKNNAFIVTAEIASSQAFFANPRIWWDQVGSGHKFE